MQHIRQYLPFANDTQQIQWALLLLDGDAALWKDKQLSFYDLLNPPAHLLDWILFIEEFRGRWLDPHEEEKALDQVLKGMITQVTSVKKYNNLFNEVVALTWLTGNDYAIQ